MPSYTPKSPKKLRLFRRSRGKGKAPYMDVSIAIKHDFLEGNGWKKEDKYDKTVTSSDGAEFIQVTLTRVHENAD